jgi:hypothetical protein
MLWRTAAPFARPLHRNRNPLPSLRLASAAKAHCSSPSMQWTSIWTISSSSHKEVGPIASPAVASSSTASTPSCGLFPREIIPNGKSPIPPRSSPKATPPGRPRKPSSAGNWTQLVARSSSQCIVSTDFTSSFPPSSAHSAVPPAESGSNLWASCAAWSWPSLAVGAFSHNFSR